MAINLQKPLGTDIYAVSVFNSNAQIIQDAVNGLLTDVENIETELPKKYPFYIITSSTFNIDNISNLENGIYYLQTNPAGTLPDNLPNTNNILINSKNGNNGSQYLFTSNGIVYQRDLTNSSVSAWQTQSVTIVDNLTTQEANVALSAQQGYVLNQKKLDVFYYTTGNTIDFDNIASGLYICDNVNIIGTIPDFIYIVNNTNHFIFESYGKINQTSVIQRISNAEMTQQGIRVGYVGTDNTWIWSQWINYNLGNSGGGGGDSNIQLEIVTI